MDEQDEASGSEAQEEYAAQLANSLAYANTQLGRGGPITPYGIGLMANEIVGVVLAADDAEDSLNGVLASIQGQLQAQAKSRQIDAACLCFFDPESNSLVMMSENRQNICMKSLIDYEAVKTIEIGADSVTIDESVPFVFPEWKPDD